MLAVIHCYVPCRHIFNEVTFFNPFPGKAKIEYKSILKTYELFMYEYLHYITNSFCNNIGNVHIT